MTTILRSLLVALLLFAAGSGCGDHEIQTGRLTFAIQTVTTVTSDPDHHIDIPLSGTVVDFERFEIAYGDVSWSCTNPAECYDYNGQRVICMWHELNPNCVRSGPAANLDVEPNAVMCPPWTIDPLEHPRTQPPYFSGPNEAGTCYVEVHFLSAGTATITVTSH
jgi:hypothetical protein